MSTEIYYFSGTGNSLYVAKELRERIPGAALIPMVSLLDQEVIETRAETVGFVFPTHLASIPSPMNKFLKKLEPRSARYIFAVGTRMGTLSLAKISIEEVLEEKGKRLDAYFLLNMPNNSPTGLVPAKGDQNWSKRNSEEKVQALDAAVRDRLDAIQGVIINRERNPKDDSPRLGLLLKRPLSRLLAWAEKSRDGTEIPYYVDSSCTGCGICEAVCPSQKITLTDGKPIWQKEVQCYFCYACFNFCPTQSILVGERYTKKDGRYSHPEITAKDIAEQKASGSP